MQKSIPIFILLLCLSVSNWGCATSGTLRAKHVTEVDLSSKNFEIIMKNAHGEAKAGYLFGASFVAGDHPQSVALIRVSGSGMLTREAMQDLWNRFESEYGPVEGRNLALINVSFDADALNVLGIYTQQSISVRADIIEFTE